MSDEKEREDEAKGAAGAGDLVDERAEGASDEGEADQSSAAGSTDDDAANPEAIARRVAALGEDDAIERQAREEERKLAERRASKKKGGSGKKGGGLEVAASKKLSKIGTRAEPKRSIAVATDADPLIEKTAKLSDWAKENQKLVQIVGGAVAVALLGIAGFLYWDHKRENDASVLLAQAVADERGHIGEPPKDAEDDDIQAAGPMFKTFDARRDSALAKYREVEARFPKTGAAILARLAEGSLLLDKRDPDGAASAFNEVKASPLAAADQEVKGRSIEGLGFAYELKAQAAPAEKDKYLDEALKTYKELENTVEVQGFKELAMYHQARVLEAKGDKDKAKELLLSLKDRVNKTDDATPGMSIPRGPAFPYLREVAMDRLREIDPSAAPKQTGGAPGGGSQLTPAQIRKMIEDAQKKQQQGGGKP